MFFHVGTTACGETYTDNDSVAAIAALYFTKSKDAMCGKQIQVNDPQSGLTATIKIVDQCANCLYGDIALSPTAFELFRNRDLGSFNVEWEFL